MLKVVTDKELATFPPPSFVTSYRQSLFLHLVGVLGVHPYIMNTPSGPKTGTYSCGLPDPGPRALGPGQNIQTPTNLFSLCVTRRGRLAPSEGWAELGG